MSLIATELESAFKSVTGDWKKAKRRADREDRVHQRDLEEMRRARAFRYTVKDAAYRVMPEAYLKASANGTLPANARQIMYAARPQVLELTEGKCWKDSSYFTQHLLPDYIEEYPEAAGWDVVFDDRGHFVEPHMDRRIGLGTLAVRRYYAGWTDDLSEDTLPALDFEVKTFGPANRYRFALFIEKEGFNELLAKAQIAKRFDVAIMSTKGMSVTAARQLVEHLSDAGVTLLVLHDFDKSGFSIVGTLCRDTRRYQYSTMPDVIDLGLRLADVQKMQLQSEPVEYGKTNPINNLEDNGATAEEIGFLVKVGGRYGWRGQRVELNAMTSEKFVAWLEKKLVAAGVSKVIPDNDMLAKAYRRAIRLAAVQKAIDDLEQDDNDSITVPRGLKGKVTKLLKEDQTCSWDEAIAKIAKDKADQ